MTDISSSILAVCAILMFVLAASGICTRLFMSKLDDVHKVVTEKIKAVEQTVANLVVRTEIIEKKGEDKEARLVRVEMAVENIKEGQVRIEQEVKDSASRIEAKIDKEFGTLVESIREMREVRPRPR